MAAVRGINAMGTAATGALATIALAVALAPAAKGQSSASEPPNVVVVMTDDVTPRDLQMMPNYQALAKRGTEFTQAFASYSLCCPARASFLTGQYAHNHGVLGNFFSVGGGFDAFEDQENTLPAWLQDAGYSTAFVGKYLNEYGGRDPELVPPGWDDWRGLVDFSTYNYFNYAVNDNGTLRYYGDRDYVEKSIELAGISVDSDRTPPDSVPIVLGYEPIEYFGSSDEADYQADVTGAIATEALSEAAGGDQPFFLYFAPIAAHREFDFEGVGRVRPSPDGPDPRPPARYEDTYDDVELPRSPSFNEAEIDDKPPDISDAPLLGDDEIDQLEEDHRGRLGALRAADDAVGDLIDELEAAGELQDTIIIYTSDQGYLQGQHRIPDEKYVAYEESIHIPLVVAGPGIPRGAENDDLVVNHDVTATIADVAGAEPGRELDGMSLLELLGGGGRADRALLVETLAPELRFEIGDPVIDAQLPYYGIRTTTHKYIKWRTGEEELYDLTEDPYELENIADDPEAADVKAELAEEAEALRTCVGRGCLNGEAGEAIPDGPVVEHQSVNVASTVVIGLGLLLLAVAGLIGATRRVRSE
jgi:N-acetylglucosamine-6-sulfatase